MCDKTSLQPPTEPQTLSRILPTPFPPNQFPQNKITQSTPLNNSSNSYDNKDLDFFVFDVFIEGVRVLLVLVISQVLIVTWTSDVRLNISTRLNVPFFSIINFF